MKIQDDPLGGEDPLGAMGDDDCPDGNWGGDDPLAPKPVAAGQQKEETAGSIVLSMLSLLVSVPALIGAWCWPALVIPLFGGVVTAASRRSGHLISFVVTLEMMILILGYVCTGVAKRKNQPFYKKFGPPLVVFIAVQLIMADPTRHIFIQSHYPLDNFPDQKVNVSACTLVQDNTTWIQDPSQCNTCLSSHDQHQYQATTFKSLAKEYFPSFYPDGSQFIETCVDLPGADAAGHTCDWYVANPCECGKHDAKGWNAADACCQCGGGGGPCKGSPDGGLHLHCLTEVGWIFTILFTYSGFLMLMWGVLWNANICQILARIRAKWVVLQQAKAGYAPVDTSGRL